jgi:hypothetical protein
MTTPIRSCGLGAAIFAAITLGALVGCAGSSGTTGARVDGGADGDVESGTPTGDGGPVVAQDCSGIGTSQTVSQPCCLANGVDACGANLFCAAFDGRKQPTCYLERSRADMTECSEDRQCTSGSCNVESSKCRSMPGGVCSEAVGCATDAGENSVCVAAKCTWTDGKTGSACASDGDCADGTCDAAHRCVGKAGATCSSGGHCGKDLCCKNGRCDDCRGGVGDECTFLTPCRPTLMCCPIPGSGSNETHCRPSCN